MIIVQTLIILVNLGVLIFLGVNFIKYNKDTNKEKIHLIYKEDFEVPLIKVTQNNKDYLFIVDTGCAYSTISCDALNTFKYELTNKRGTTYGVNGKLEETVFVNCKFDVNDYHIEQEFQCVECDNFVNNNETGYNIAGLLGSDFLKRNKFIVDVDRLIMYKQ